MILDGKIILTGKGLHSGNECKLVIENCESPEIIMCDGENEIPLRKMRSSGTNRGSDYFFPDGKCIKTCEHVLSALTGMGIYSGVKLTVNGGEMPALDGCAEMLCCEISKHYINTDSQQPIKITSPVIVSSDDKKRFVAAFPAEGLHITYVVEYEYIGSQIYDYEHCQENYMKDIAAARTFALAKDIEYLFSHGMALGGSLDNAILVGETIEARGGLRWPDEFVRHKVLDIIGDLASLGRPLNAHIIALRAGHELHLKFAEKLRGE